MVVLGGVRFLMSEVPLPSPNGVPRGSGLGKSVLHIVVWLRGGTSELSVRG